MANEEGSTKYLIKASIKTDGVVERPDVVGAVFGQTEGVLEENLDLRELQKSGKIGRINVNVRSESGKSKGAISIPSSLGKDKTAMIAAALETIDRVGPCEAEIQIDKIQDTREAKKQFIQERAKELVSQIDDTEKESEKIEKKTSSGKGREVEKYKGLPAGPKASQSDAIIVVEGRSDVINLLENGIKNTVAIEGTSVPPVISEITKKKTATAFLDGDRGGDLILKELFQVAELDNIARAPNGKTVEDLSGDEIRKALKEKAPAEKAKTEALKEEESSEEEEKEKLSQLVDDLKATTKAKLLDSNIEEIEEVKVRKLADKFKESENVRAIVFDGVITQKLADMAVEKDLKYLVGMRERLKEKPENIEILTPEDL